ncbi:MAG: NUDIX hydrolase [Candidatus Aenigmarchaeota archaeon]|nr:NUDIX hydrolase [Candidatus Aenigmarchaeota archaeon]
MKTILATDIVGSDFARGVYQSTVLGYVSRNGNGKEILVAERRKPDDPLRAGQLVIPGGGTEKQDVVYAAQREVLEETGVETKSLGIFTFSGLVHTILRDGKYATVVIQPPTKLWIRYKDSGKCYTGYIVRLKPLSEPKNMESDAANPRYMCLDQALEEIDKFTPGSGVALEMIGSEEFGTNPVKNDDVIIDEDIPLGDLLKVIY